MNLQNFTHEDLKKLTAIESSLESMYEVVDSIPYPVVILEDHDGEFKVLLRNDKARRLPISDERLAMSAVVSSGKEMNSKVIKISDAYVTQYLVPHKIDGEEVVITFNIMKIGSSGKNRIVTDEDLAKGQDEVKESPLKRRLVDSIHKIRSINHKLDTYILSRATTTAKEEPKKLIEESDLDS